MKSTISQIQSDISDLVGKIDANKGRINKDAVYFEEKAESMYGELYDLINERTRTTDENLFDHEGQTRDRIAEVKEYFEELIRNTVHPLETSINELKRKGRVFF